MTRAGDTTGPHDGDPSPTGVSVIPWDDDQTVALVDGTADPRDEAAMVRVLRRFGLQPEPVVALPDGAPFDRDHACWRVRIGAFVAVIGPTDPRHPALSGSRDRHTTTVVALDPSIAVDGDVDTDRDLFKLLALLIDALDAMRVFWSPARLWSDAAAFRGAVVDMARTGMPPLMHLIAFVTDRDDPDGLLHCTTRGLSHFTGQELTWSLGDTELSRADAARRLARLALDAMLHGPIVVPATIEGLAAGERIALSSRGVRDGVEWIDVRHADAGSE